MEFLFPIIAGGLIAYFILIPACNKIDIATSKANIKWELYRNECIKYTTYDDCRERYTRNLSKPKGMK